MNSIWQIIIREFGSRVKSRPFVLMTLLIPTLLFAIHHFSGQTSDGDNLSSTLGSGTESIFQLGLYGALLIYIFLSQYAIMVMQSVMQEKKNRLAEVLLTIVSPQKLLSGKITAIALAGILQMGIWVFIGYYCFSISTHFPHFLPHLTLTFLGCFMLYFIGGYLLYASMLAIIGSAVSDNADTQQFVLPVTLVLLLSFFAAIEALGQPFAPLSQLWAFVPFTSPVVMIARFPFGIPWVEIVPSLLILYVTGISFLLWAAHIYRHTILQHSISMGEQIKELLRLRR